MRTRDVCLSGFLALALTSAPAGEIPPSPDADLARQLNNLGGFRFDRGEYGRAESLFTRATALGQRDAVFNLAATLRAEARYSEAETMYQRALDLRESEVPRSPNRIASALSGLALLYRDTARFAESEKLARRALDLRQQAAEPDETGIAWTLNLVGTLAQAQERTAEAARLFQQALDTAEKAPSPDAPTMADILINMGNAERSSGDLGNAEQHLARAVQALGENGDRVRTAAALNGLVLVKRARGDFKQARLLGTRALLLLEAALGKEHPDYAAALSSVALVDQDLRNFREARELYREALAIDQRALGPGHPRVAADLNNLGVAATRQRDYTSAESYFRQALRLEEERTPGSGQSAFRMANLAALYVLEKRSRDALELYRRAAGILCATDHQGDLRVAAILHEYAELLRAAGSFAEAEDADTRAMHIRVKYVLVNQGDMDHG